MVAAGGLSSNVQDMLAYLTAQYQQQTPAIKQSHEVLFRENVKQGTACLWVVTTLKDGNHLIWHNGATGGSTSFCGFIPETGDRIVVLSNSSQSVDQLAIQLMRME
jgi:CubicO group peptidase (beta-lactamase class C family)